MSSRSRQPSPRCSSAGPATPLALHQAERWRAELIADDEATTRFAAAHAGADLQRLRALVRNARKDAALAPEQRSGRAYRELFSSSASRAAMSEASAAGAGARDRVRIGLVSVSDRASSGVYEDKGIPALRELASQRAVLNPVDWETRLIADERGRRSPRRCASSSTTPIATSSSPPAAPARRRATSRPRRRWRSRPRRCPASASRCARSACTSCRPRSCRARSR